MEWLCVHHLAFLIIFLVFSPIIQGVDGLIGKDSLSLRCPVRKLKGGRVRMRNKGRVVKYVCLRGAQVLGVKYSTCVRGQWDSPVPICINSGCLPVDVPHGQVLETYRGAMVTVHCDPGYSLVGSQSLYCNGATWNDTAPTCREIQVKAQKWCDFESEDLCGWTHDINHDFDWRRHNFATPSGHDETGPSFDHTLGPGLNGHYMYLEVSSPRLENDTARLFSPVFDTVSDAGSCFIFWYHMFGETTGTLNVYLHKQDTVLLFSKTGNQGNQWLQAIIPLPKFSSRFQIVIEGVRGNGYKGDIAIDDVQLADGEHCPMFTSVTVDDDDVSVTDDSSTTYGPTGDDGVILATESSSSCLRRCFLPTAEPSMCECTSYCIGNNTCCPDFVQICSTGVSETKAGNKFTTESNTSLSETTAKIETSTMLPNTTVQLPNTTIQLANTTIQLPNTTIQLPNTTASISTQYPEVPNTTVASHLLSSTTTHRFSISSNNFNVTVKVYQKNANVTILTTPQLTTTTTVAYVAKTTSDKTDFPLDVTRQSNTTALNKSVTVTTTPTSVTSRQKVFSTKIPDLSTNSTSGSEQSFPRWNPIRPIPTKMKNITQIPKIEFVTPPPPVIFRKPAKSGWPFNKSLQNETTFNASIPFIAQNPEKPVNKTEKAAKSINDVLHSGWMKNSSSKSNLSPLGPNPEISTSKTTTITKHSFTTLPPVTSNTYRLNPSQTSTGPKLKLEDKQRDDAPVHAQFANTSASATNHVVHILVVVSGVLLALVAMAATVCTLRRRRINRRKMEDDELDIQFLASDEILDFTLARPSIEDIQMSETRRLN